MICVVIESPFAAVDRARWLANVDYARAAVLDSLMRDEAPIASHLLYPQILDDDEPEARALGVAAGLVWGARANFAAFYTDRGWSRGMLAARTHYDWIGLRYVERSLDDTAQA